MKFDEAQWLEAIGRPDWYQKFYNFITRAQAIYPDGSEELNQIAKDSRHFFEQALADNLVALASSGLDLDSERKAIDTIVIHHTSHTPGYRKSYMNATQLLNIYVPYFVNPTVKGEEILKGQPIWSGHLEGGRQVFYAYHWLMRMDGSFECLLPDDAIGWHSGNWEVNRRSIGICLDNDYENSEPTDEVLQQLATHISRYYGHVGHDRILGHRECREGTICPGTTFITTWKQTLVNLLD